MSKKEKIEGLLPFCVNCDYVYEGCTIIDQHCIDCKREKKKYFTPYKKGYDSNGMIASGYTCKRRSKKKLHDK